MKTYFHPGDLESWAMFNRYLEEKERGLVHSDEWREQMKTLEAELQAFRNDANIVRGLVDRSANIAKYRDEHEFAAFGREVDA